MAGRRVDERYAAEVDAKVYVGETVVPARTKNVSSGGMCFEVDHAIELGNQVRLELSLVTDDPALSEPIELSACVVWCTAIANERFQIGTSFTEMTNETRNDLAMFVRFLREAPESEEPPVGHEEMFS